MRGSAFNLRMVVASQGLRAREVLVVNFDLRRSRNIFMQSNFETVDDQLTKEIPRVKLQ